MFSTCIKIEVFGKISTSLKNHLPVILNHGKAQRQALAFTHY